MIDELARSILPVVLANITTPYPYHDSHFMLAGEPPHDPMLVHPAFGNSFDWHSSVHSHWTALQLIEHFSSQTNKPDGVTKLEEAVDANLQQRHIDAELSYLERRPSYERPYGWAWAMMLAAASDQSTHPAVRQYAPRLRALAEWAAQAAMRWLEILPIPVRHGVHSNSAFAMGLMYDASVVLGAEDLREAMALRARNWFATDRNWPAHFERSGNDFVSPGMTEADLMRRVLPQNEFATWWSEFLPGLCAGSPMLTPVHIPDVEDGHVVHLHGLNLSRAGALARIGRALQTPALVECARSLYEASISRVASGYYTETHWLPTFAWDAAKSIVQWST
jgi:Protein of unknown function (DUF2891)